MPVKKQIKKTVKKPAPRRKVAPVENKSKMVSFGRAISRFFRKYFQFNGVATRAEYWWVILFVIVVGFVLMMATFLLQHVNLLLAGFVALLWVLFCIVILVPLWAVMARRLHDIGLTAKLLWISFIFFVYSMLVPEVMGNVKIIDWVSFAWGIIILVLFLLPSKTNNNPYRD